MILMKKLLTVLVRAWLFVYTLALRGLNVEYQ